MADDTIVWNLRGISEAARAHARAEAEAAGIPIGEWLSERIRQAAEGDTGVEPARAGPAVETGSQSTELDDQIDEILRRAEAVTRDQVNDLRGSLEHLAQRLQRLENAEKQGN